MALTFAGTLDRTTLLRASTAVRALVVDERVAARWDHDSALPGMTVGGLARHLVSQPECAVEFLTAEQPADADVVSLVECYERADWFHAPVDHEANTSISAGFNAMAAGGAAHSVAVLDAALASLPGAVAGAVPTTYVPWQDCALALDDFLVVRLMETVVHADDLAVSVGADPLTFDDEVLHPVLALLAVLGARRHSATAVLRGLSRAERSTGPVAAF
ncbi:maleylpyruvate isomerase N-terminal domain-containing protein [Nocardioides rubriscoriae]|uniref:maleylpyruvate isomerase N-terminal domain-containing protein n=1 Tax=Nocardioides rubriscoriae TaxID=642762 RepID=UPI001478246E|nr:maleylpyruvate isomerase N-terminal domain-containing protein [Nocardioides rubriscoriae]